MSFEDVAGEKAVSRFLNGYNCAQSVLLTISEHWNGEDILVPKIATAFGGGIGRCRSVCGALNSGVKAIGIKYGTDELIGYDLSDPEESEKARDAEVFRKKCPRLDKDYR